MTQEKRCPITEEVQAMIDAAMSGGNGGGKHSEMFIHQQQSEKVFEVVNWPTAFSVAPGAVAYGWDDANTLGKKTGFKDVTSTDCLFYGEKIGQYIIYVREWGYE